jgi:hypothetical protein
MGNSHNLLLRDSQQKQLLTLKILILKFHPVPQLRIPINK